MIIHNCEQLSEEWFDLRLGKITGSAMHDLLTKGGGKVRNKRIYMLVAERMTRKRCDASFSNRHTDRGHELESEARLIYEMIKGVSVETVGFIEINKYLGVSPDGLVDKDGGLEIKCLDNHTFIAQKLLGVKGIIPSYVTQIQLSLMVSGRKWWDFMCYNPNFRKPFIHRIEPDLDFHKVLKEEIDRANKEIAEIIKGIA